MKSAHKIKEWKERSKEALSHEVLALREKLRSLHFLLSSGKLKNVREIQEIRKDIARIMTVMKHKT
jgi:large subunit ribosomal protein L29